MLSEVQKQLLESMKYWYITIDEEGGDPEFDLILGNAVGDDGITSNLLNEAAEKLRELSEEEKKFWMGEFDKRGKLKFPSPQKIPVTVYHVTANTIHELEPKTIYFGTDLKEARKAFIKNIKSVLKSLDAEEKEEYKIENSDIKNLEFTTWNSDNTVVCIHSADI